MSQVMERRGLKHDESSTPATKPKSSDRSNTDRRHEKRDRSPLDRSNYFDRDRRSKDSRRAETKEDAKKKISSRCRLFVGNLSSEVKEKDLKEVFEKYGEITEFFMSSKGFSFVRMDTRAHAETAKEELDGIPLKGRNIRVRYAVHGASLKISELSPHVSNELLIEAFQIFGDIERAVHILDDRSQPTGEGIVEFERKPGAVDALRRINEGVFLLTSNPKPIFVEPLEPRDVEDGLGEHMVQKNPQYSKERMQPPRFALPGSFEFEFGNRWKELYRVERMRRDQLEREFREAREKLENEMELAYQEYQTAQLREDLRRRQEELERLEASRRDRIEQYRMREEERNRERQHMPPVGLTPFQLPQEQMLQMRLGMEKPPPRQMDLHRSELPVSNVMLPASRSNEQIAHGVQRLMQFVQQGRLGGIGSLSRSIDNFGNHTGISSPDVSFQQPRNPLMRPKPGHPPFRAESTDRRTSWGPEPERDGAYFR